MTMMMMMMMMMVMIMINYYKACTMHLQCGPFTTTASHFLERFIIIVFR